MWRRIIDASAVILLVSPSGLGARLSTNETVRSGLWSDPSVWSAGVVPVSTDDVIVKAGHRITVPSILAQTYASLTVEVTGTVDVVTLFNVTTTNTINIDGSIVGRDGGQELPGASVMLTAGTDSAVAGSLIGGNAGATSRVIVRASQPGAVTAQGHAGAPGGSVELRSTAGGVYLFSTARIVTGNPGDGGYAEAIGWNATSAGEDGGSATAYAGSGGNAGTLHISAQNGTGTVSIPAVQGILTVGRAGAGGQAATHGGKGGDADDSHVPGVSGATGGRGGDAGSVEITIFGPGIPDGGNPGYDEYLSARLSPGSAEAAAGGSASSTEGGNGIIPIGVNPPQQPGHPGLPGIPQGGGNGSCTNYNILGGGQGGDATAKGGDGGPGCPGGTGGSATATGGAGANGPGGKATATGGRGGDGLGICCEEGISCPGCDGGPGGPATATGGPGGWNSITHCTRFSLLAFGQVNAYPSIGYNGGDAVATGGRGGDGGHGRPPGSGGAGGLGQATGGAAGIGFASNGHIGKATPKNGAPGSPGTECTGGTGDPK